MPAKSTKRSLDGAASAAPPAKKARISTVGSEAIQDLLTLTPAALSALPVETLVKHITALQQQVRESQAGETKDPNQNKDLVRKQVKALRNAVHAAIEAQMKWQPSCKTSGKRWSYTSLVPSATVFYKVWRMDEKAEEGKKWKVKKMPVAEFESVVGECTASIRYGYLSITSKEVTLKWDREGNSFTVSGLYGL